MTYLTKNVYDVIKQRSLFGFEERKKEVNYMDAKVFGKFIMERRKQLGMTQAELAEKINVTDKAVSRWERGLGFPDINTLEPLADALGDRSGGAYEIGNQYRKKRNCCRSEERSRDYEINGRDIGVSCGKRK